MRLSIRSKSQIVTTGAEVEFVEGREVTLDCQYQVDSALLGGLHVSWFKDGVNLDIMGHNYI